MLIAVLLIVAGPVTAGPALAAPGEGCGSGGTVTGLVTVDAPAANAVVSGTFAVRGTANAGLPLGEVSRVEVTLGGTTFSETYDPANTVAFSVDVDSTNMAPGQKTMTVVACGTTLAGLLSRGATQVPVKVEAAPIVTSTSLPRSTTTVTAPSSSVPGGGSVTTVASTGGAAASAGAGVATGPTTTAASGPTTTAAPAEARAPTRADPVRPRSGPDTPLVLTETPSKPGSGPPLWVGAVVGISGGLGLLFSAASWRRRTRPPLRAEPVDPDLVDVA